MNLARRVKKALLRKILPIPVEARHAEYSVISSTDDDAGRPSRRLLSLVLQAIGYAQDISLDELNTNRKRSLDNLSIWPGVHYRLLAGLVLAIKPKLAIEIGTGGGAGCLAIKQKLPDNSKVVTFDITPWKSHPDSALEERDFEDRRLIQHIDDLSKPSVFSNYRTLFEDAHMIFVDALKDGITEKRLLEEFENTPFRTNPIIVFDDIRVWNMLKIWRDIKRPKLDLTSFGHWTGTGIVEWV